MLPIHLINLPQHADKLKKFKQNNPFLLNDLHVFQAYDGYTLPRRQLVLEKNIAENIDYNPRALGIMKSHIELWKIAAQSPHGITIVEDDAIFHKDFPQTSKKLMKGKPDFDLIAWSYNLDWPIQIQTAKGIPTSLLSYQTRVGNDKNFESYGQTGAYGHIINQKQYLDSSFHPKLIRTLSFAGLSCYTLSPKGAQFLLDQLPIEHYDIFFISHTHIYVKQSGIDISMTYFYDKMHAYICSPFLAFTPNEQST